MTSDELVSADGRAQGFILLVPRRHSTEVQAVASALLLPHGAHGRILWRSTRGSPHGCLVVAEKEPMGRRSGLPGFLGHELPSIARSQGDIVDVHPDPDVLGK
eukprot:6485387-Amphidinium_carterae.1